MSDPKNFHVRLKQACDDVSIIPEKGAGRQVWVAKKLHVSEEAVRKWFTGESRPRVDKMDALAALLNVDAAWLSLGVSPELSRVEQRAWTEKAEGLVYVLFGHITAQGGHCAFPSKTDPSRDVVDFYAIIRGQQLAVHVSVGREISKHTWLMPIPRKWQDVFVVGGVQTQDFVTEWLVMPHDMIDRFKSRKGGAHELAITKTGGQFLTGDEKWPMLKHDLHAPR